MGKKGRAKALESISHAPISLREEVTGKIQTKAASNTKSKLRFEHLKNLAVWATTNDPPIQSLGAFYGHQFATFGEAIGVPPDNSLIICERFVMPLFVCLVVILILQFGSVVAPLIIKFDGLNL